MGGLVIKRAFIIAKQREEFHTLAERVHTILFLATPHRGADRAQLLSRILNLTPGSRPFIADLHRNSIATQSINDEFPQYCQDLQLYSFYETLPTAYGVAKSLVVDKDLATLGYVNERTAYLNADHHDVCKFATQSDPNYRTVRNALIFAIDGCRDDAIELRRRMDHEQKRLLDNYLGVTDAPEDDLMGIDALRMEGSCAWLVQRESFQQWRDSANTQLYWISAKPATGKTVLSGSVIHHLRKEKRDLAFYFFDYRNKAKTAINSFLLSVAWQMAQMHPEVFDALLKIMGKDDQLLQADYRTVWRKVYMESILRTTLNRPQYWVIDALDECAAGSELVPLLLKVVEWSPIRILLTSRHQFESHQHVIRPGVKVVSEEIQEADTKTDIALYVEANMEYLPFIDDDARRRTMAKILVKSAGCFLWVHLTLQELRQVHTSAEVRQVLEDIPSDMNRLYSRILDGMAMATYGKTLAIAILTWTVCSMRPLTTHELYHALQIDLKDGIDNIERSIESSCGQLVYVDAQSRVQMVHQTVRDYLLQAGSTTEFAIDCKLGHKRMAMSCLQYLNGVEMRGPRHRRLSANKVSKQRCSFVAYACNFFFEHMSHAASTDDEILSEVTKFLKSSNVLSWIEYIAQHSNLNQLIQAGMAFKNFLRRRSKHLPPLGKDVSLLDSWATDLVRLVTKFGNSLLAYPPAIFQLIPPFCPPQTALKKQFGSSPRGIGVLGWSTNNWDDCLSIIGNPDERFSALACSEKYFAIGMSSGKIAVHNEVTCQEIRKLQHGEPVRILQFGKSNKILASAGQKKVRVWNTFAWEQSWEFDTTRICMSIMFLEEQQLLLGALKNNHLMIWDLVAGTLRESADWTLDLEGPNTHAYRWPIAAAFSPEASLLAIVYRGQDILLWDLERDATHDTYCKESGARVHPDQRLATSGATNLIFNLRPNANLLAVTYSDGDLVLFDTLDGTVRATTLANGQTLASSLDGRTLASGDASGTIQLFDFETLKLLYRITSEEDNIRMVVFSSDSRRLLDIRGCQCRVWDPTVLVRQDVDEDYSDTVSVSTAPQEYTEKSTDGVVLISSGVCHRSQNVFLSGKEDGSVYLHETRTGQQSHKLFGHADGAAVLYLYLDEDNQIVISVDHSSRVMAHRLAIGQQGWEASKPLFDHREGVAVNQVLCNSAFTRLLMSTAQKDTLWSMETDKNTIIEEVPWDNRGIYRWASHPSRLDQLILITNNIAHLYNWQTLQRLTSDNGILLEGSILPELVIRSISHCCGGTVISTTFSESSKPQSESRLLLWNASDFCIESKKAIPIPRYRALANEVKSLLGEHGQRLVFLHASNWVCSANLQSSSIDDYDRHFFLPNDWISTDRSLLFGLASNGDIVFVKRDQIAIVKRGLNNIELKSPEPRGRPSLPGRPRPSLTVPES